MWGVLLGGLLAILGGLIATWIQLKNVRKVRMEELIAERKVQANAEAYGHLKRIEGSFIAQSHEDTIALVMSLEEWFFANRLFLPRLFPEYWLSMRGDLHRRIRWEEDSSKSPGELSAVENAIQLAMTGAIYEIYKDMDLKQIDMKKLKAPDPP